MRYPCFILYTTSLPLSTGGQRIFIVRNDLSARCAHEGKTGTDEREQVYTETPNKNPPKTSFTLPRPGLEPR